MRRLTDWTACLASILLFTQRVLSAPELAFPINAQVPPVAYAAKQYRYAFADSTFRSDASPITYAIADAPQWLSIDSGTRTLRGTPAESDVGAFTFVLDASDGTGSTATSVTLVVVAQQSISLGETILSSLQAVGQVQQPSTLFLSPLTSFTIPISQQVFSGTTVSTTYYAVSDDNSPLPSWIQFDAQSRSLTGTTPPILSTITQQQIYGVKVIATNVAGFSESGITFTIAVANRILYFQSATEIINVTRGEIFKSQAYRDILYSNGSPITGAQLGTVQANLPSWLSLDTTKITLSGTPPEDFTTQLITISAQDQSNDIANLTVTLRSATATTRGEPLNITARQGEYLVATISPSIVQAGDQTTVDLGDTASWLSFSQTNTSFYGQVPENLDPTTLVLSLAVTGSDSVTTYPVTLTVVAAEQTASASSSISPSRTGGIVSNTSTAEQNARGTPTHALAIGLTVGFVVLAVFIIIFILCWCKRRREKKGAEKELSDDGQGGSHYSSAASIQREESIIEEVVDVRPMTAASRHTDNREMFETPSKVPQVELPWAPDSLKRARSRLQKKRPAKAHDSFDSNWGGLVAPRSTAGASPVLTEEIGPDDIIYPEEPPPIPSYSPKRNRSLASTRVAKRTNSKRSNDQRASQALSNLTNRRSGLPNRLSNAGVGHGSGILSPALISNPYRNSKPPPTRSSWATTYASTIGGKENMRPSIATTQLEHFPIPPSTSHQDRRSGERTSGSYAGLTDTKPSLAGLASATTKPSLRLISASPNSADNAFDAEEFSHRRQHYLETRSKLTGSSILFPNSSSRSRTPSLSRFMPGTQAIRSPSNTFPIAEESIAESPSRQPPSMTTNWSKLTDFSPAPLATSNRAQRPTNSHILSPTPQRPPTRFGPNHNSNVPSQYGNEIAAGAGTRASRAISISSGQFSSALSSDDASQWEDLEPPDIHSPYQGGGIRAVSYAETATDDLLQELVNDDGVRQWTTTSSSAGNSAAPSPRLPFDGGRPSGETEELEARTAIQKAIRRASQLGSGESRGLRLVDKRKRIISVDGKEGRKGATSSGSPRRGRNSGVGASGAAESSVGYAWGGREKSQKGSLRFI